MSDRFSKAAPWIVFAVTLLVYLAFPTRNFYWDGITFAQWIEDAGGVRASLLHPNHLVYEAAAGAIYYLFAGLGFGVRALGVMQYVNCILGAATAAAFYRLLKDVVGSVHLALIPSLIYAFSATWWKFSTDADAYIPSILFLVLAFHLALPQKKPRPLLLAFVHAVAMCFHQLAVFFFPVALAAILLQSRSLRPRNRFVKAGLYAVTASVLTFGGYCFSYYLITGGYDPSGLARWMTSFSTENGFMFDAGKSLKHTLQGEVKLFFEGRFSFIREIPFWVAGSFLATLAAAAVWFSVSVARFVRAGRDDGATAPSSPELRSTMLLCLLWVGAYVLFLFFWIPQNTFYRMFYMPALLVLIAAAAKRFRVEEKAPGLLPAFVTLMALSNFLFFIYPYSRVRKETPLDLSLRMNDVWSADSTVFYTEMVTDDQLLRYFNPATRWVRIPSPEVSNLRAAIEKLGPTGDNWLDTTLLRQLRKDEIGRAFIETHTEGVPRYSLTDPAYDLTLVRVRP